MASLSSWTEPLVAIEARVGRGLRVAESASAFTRVVVTVATGLFGLVLNWWIGPPTSLLLAYVASVACAAWLFSHRWPAIVAALVLSFGSGLIIEVDDDGPRSLIVWINAGLRGVVLLALGLIISVLKRQLNTSEELAFTDTLTGLDSRHAILAELDAAIAASERSGRPVSVAYFDLDGLKSVNDTSGHAAGDALIRDFASSLRSNVRPSDRIGRIGGDEFVLVCRDATSNDVTRVVERVLRADDMPSASWGVSTSHRGATSTDLLEEADAAMYAARQSRRSGR